jgi:putative transcriptional regulator
VTVVDAVPPLAVIAQADDVVHVGGPVQPEAIIVLGEFEDPTRAGALVLDSVGFLPASIEETDEIGSLLRLRVFAGYAGWAAGQLESEIEDDAWIVTPAVNDDAFTGKPEELWSSVLQRMGGAYAVLARMPPDPSLN